MRNFFKTAVLALVLSVSLLNVGCSKDDMDLMPPEVKVSLLPDEQNVNPYNLKGNALFNDNERCVIATVMIYKKLAGGITDHLETIDFDGRIKTWQAWQSTIILEPGNYEIVATGVDDEDNSVMATIGKHLD